MIPFLAILGRIPARDYLYVAIIAFLTFEYFHLQHVGAERQARADAEADQRVAAVATAVKAADDADYAAKLQATKDEFDAQLQASAATADELTGRLRVYAARRCPVLPSPGTAAPGEPATASSPDPVESAIEQLIRAAEHDLVVIDAERAERDALTGK